MPSLIRSTNHQLVSQRYSSSKLEEELQNSKATLRSSSHKSVQTDSNNYEEYPRCSDIKKAEIQDF